MPSLRDQILSNYNTRYRRSRIRRDMAANAMPISRKSHASGIRKKGSTNLPSGATEDPITAYEITQAKLAKKEIIATRIIF